jgi:hypothetical protein
MDNIDPMDQAEAKAVCDHFFASHIHHGMSVQLCMVCGEPDWDDLRDQLYRARGVLSGFRVTAKNLDGQWVPDIPVPYWILFGKKCAQCGKNFWTMRGYRGHYALAHILKLS